MKKLARVVCVAVALMAAQSALAYVDVALHSLKLLTEMPPIPLFGTESTVYGLQLSFFPEFGKDCGHSRLCETKNIYGVQLSIVNGNVVHNLYGLRLGVLTSGNVGSNNHECCNGIQIGTLGSASERVYGLQLGGACALAGEMNGIQVSGFMVKSTKLRGVDVAMLSLSEDVYGMQIGLVNKASRAYGVQIGLYNEAAEGFCLQIGAVNHVPDRTIEYLPLFNIR
ncbi:MAG: hypothetical protein IJI35_09515 [Kiritimatiellae bacterium]|nr:hypothetical protein [Kiritimatiellia bacterium]